MAILAIDPGPDQSGWVEWDGTRVIQSGISPNGEVLTWVWHADPKYLVAIEMIRSYGMAVGASVFDTCRWVGRFEQAARSTGHDVRICYRPDVKLHLCRSSRAKDSNVRQALLDRVGPQGVKKAPGPTYGVKSHAWAALAVAVYAHDMEDARDAGVAPF